MKRLSKIFDEPERKISKVISKLEVLSGHHSEDVQLLAQMQTNLKSKLLDLGLDPGDTTGEELYHSLSAKLTHDFEIVAKAWQLQGENNITALLESVATKEPVLSIKCASLKVMLKALPPKKTMKALGYRSLDSMIKREDTRIVMAAAHALENAVWKSQLGHKVSQLKTRDYELRQIKFFQLEPKRYKKLETPDNFVAYGSLVGAVYLWPSKSSIGPEVVLLALQAEESLQAESFYLSANQFNKDFNKLAERLFSGFQPTATYIADQPFITPAQTQHLVQKNKTLSGYAKFCLMHPALDWWKDTAGLAAEVGKPVSMHISDVMASLGGKLGYEQRFFHNFSAEFKNNLLSRYHEYEGVKNYLGEQIDDTFISLENANAKTLVPEFEEATF